MIEMKHPLTCMYHQNFLRRINISQNKATNIIKIRVYIPQKTIRRTIANRSKTNTYFVYRNIEFTKYKTINVLEKFIAMTANKLCYNCFQGHHFSSKCKSKSTCFKNNCSAKHNTALHKYFTSNQMDGIKKGKKEDPSKNSHIKRKKKKINHLQAWRKSTERGFLYIYYQ